MNCKTLWSLIPAFGIMVAVASASPVPAPLRRISGEPCHGML